MCLIILNFTYLSTSSSFAWFILIFCINSPASNSKRSTVQILFTSWLFWEVEGYNLAWWTHTFHLVLLPVLLNRCYGQGHPQLLHSHLHESLPSGEIWDPQGRPSGRAGWSLRQELKLYPQADFLLPQRSLSSVFRVFQLSKSHTPKLSNIICLT